MPKHVSNSKQNRPLDPSVRSSQSNRFGRLISWFRGENNTKHAKNAKRVFAVFLAVMLSATVVGIIPVSLAAVKWRKLSKEKSEARKAPVRARAHEVLVTAKELANSFVVMKPTAADKRKAIAQFVEAHLLGDPDALKSLLDLAHSLANAGDAQLAREAYKSAAVLGDGEAQAVYGSWLRAGTGLDAKVVGTPNKGIPAADLEEGLEWIKKSAKQEHHLGLFHLAKYYQDELFNSKKARKCFKKAANHGSYEAIARLGNAYELGHLGYKINLKKALKYYELGGEEDFVCQDGVRRLMKQLTKSSKSEVTPNTASE